ncbi:MAG TPA: SatD family protein [Flavobacterium sp.]|jgi:hypothetical protein|nr:SatD family protein [Flavobacterium sp.]
MTSIITGDITNSGKVPTDNWINLLKERLQVFGKMPSDWEIYRGDEFQLEVGPADALMAAISIKAALKTLKLDARMSIGIGDKSYNAQKITESNGTAFIRSGQLFETLRQRKIALAIDSGNVDFDQQMNLMLRFAATITDGWLPQSAEFVLAAIDNPELSQEEIGQKLGINQAAVSRRQKRSNFDLIVDLNLHYKLQIKKLSQ